MPHTGLTIGGFIQPIVARNLLEQPINIEKGLCQRFLWIAPKPMSVPFNELQCADHQFSTAIGECVRNSRYTYIREMHHHACNIFRMVCSSVYYVCVSVGTN